MSHEKYQACIDACNECATECSHCAMACLKEEDVKKLIRCINLDLECAAMCRATAEMMSLGSNYSNELCEICATICEACAVECQKHAHMSHCKHCAAVCKRCAAECRMMSEL